MNTKNLQAKYILTHAFYWTMICVCGSFISLYLQGLHFSDSEIGLTTAVFSIVSFLLQPVFGNLSDRFKQFTWKRMMLVLGTGFLLVCILMLFNSEKILGGVFLGLIYVLANLIQPFINSIYIYYSKAGVKMNYGVARGTGAATNATLALFIGAQTRIWGIRFIPAAGILVSIGFLVFAMSLPYVNQSETDEKEKKEKTGVALPVFFRKYPLYMMMLLALFFMYFSHHLIVIYLLQIIQSLGGNSADLGITMAAMAVSELPVLFGFTKIMKRIAVDKLMVVAGFGFLLKAVLYVFAGSMTAIYLIQLTQMISFAILAVGTVYYTARQIEVADQTTGQALVISVKILGVVIGSLTGGPILELAGIRTLLFVNVVVALTGLVLAFVSVRLSRKIVHIKS